MRLWTLHPRHLDPKGLVALWREALLAQAVLAGATRGYRHHPQLQRFRRAPAPQAALSCYLRHVAAEAAARGYRFDSGRILPGPACEPLPASQGQLDFEWEHLRRKLALRAPEWLARLEADPAPHPLFALRPGPVEDWEKV